MTRCSNDEYRGTMPDGSTLDASSAEALALAGASSVTLVNGFDYDLQVWVRDGIVLNCGHPVVKVPDHINGGFRAQTCCNARAYAGQTIKAARETEARTFGHVASVPVTQRGQS